MRLNWFLSRTVRQATTMCRHVHKLCQAQRDTLNPQARAAVDESVDETRRLIASWPGRPALIEQMNRLEKAAVKHLKPYPNASMRENIEVLLVAIAVAMGIRTFFLQPFKIPTGSMQPTLYGITEQPLGPQAEIPNALVRFLRYWFTGVSYVHLVAKADGQLVRAYPPQRFLIFNLRQRFEVGNETYTVWFPPDDLLRRVGLVFQGSPTTHFFHKGDDIIKAKIISGDHLFVDRLTYNFRRPERGEIVVFETHGITALPPDQQDQYYIKRLIGKGGERIQIGDDRHVIVDGKRLDAATPHFELVYSFSGPPQESVYSGHVNQTIADRNQAGNLARKFQTEKSVFSVHPDHYVVMGDNTLNSSDSRTWGDFEQEKVIGRAYFVYWPIGDQEDRTSRFGWTTSK
jgi:signal peptidase I